MTFVSQKEDGINVSTLFNRIHSSTPPLVKVFLLFKCSTNQASYFYFLVFFFKLYGPLIISSNFNYNSLSSNKSILKITNTFRIMTFTHLYSKFTNSPTYYYTISLIIFLFELFLLIYTGVLYAKINKNRQKHIFDYSSKRIHLNIFGKIMFYLNILLTQHIMEHCIIIFYIYLIKNGYLRGNEMYLNSNSYGYYIKSSFYINVTNNTLNISLMIVNILTFILINLFSTMAIYIINTPIIHSKSFTKIRNKTICTMIFISQYIMLLHPLEIYLKGIALKIYVIIIYIIIILSICIVFTSNLNCFEHNTHLFPFVIFCLGYIFISSVIEIIIFLGNYIIQTMEIVYLILIKLFISFLFLLLYYSYKDMIFIKACENSIFNVYDDLNNCCKVDLESFFYLLEKLFLFNKETNKKDKNCLCAILAAILLHIKTCKIEYCKCKHLNLIPQNYQTKEIFRIILLKRIGFIIETSFIKINYTLQNNIELALLLSEYFFLIKGNFFMAYSILYSYFSVNLQKMSYQELLTFYTLQEKYVKEIENLIVKEDKFIKFADVIKNENMFNNFNNMMIKYCSNYIEIINIKEAIESTLKIDYFNNSTVVKKITSKNLNNKSLTHFVCCYSNQYKLYHLIKTKAKQFKYTVRTFMYYYKIFLFFILFDGKVPKTILHNFSYVSEQKETLYGLSFKETCEKFEYYLNEYFSKNKNKNHIILLDCNKGIQMKTFSVELANTLKFQHKSLIGENFDNIFPTFFKNIHTKAMLSYLIQNRNNFYMIRKTYIFTYNNTAIPCIIKSAVFPQFSKNLLIIIEVSLIDEKDHFCLLLNQYYETISISKTLEDNLSMNLEVIKKCNINIMDIFDITHNYLDKHFSQFKNQASSKETMLNYNTKEILARYFYINNKHFGETNNNNVSSVGKSTNVYSSSGQMENYYQYDKKKINFELCVKSNKLLKIKHETYLEKKRSTVLSNLFRIIHNSSELEIKDDIKFKFGEMYRKYKHSTFNLEMSSRHDEMYYIINIKSVLVYNTPLFMIEMKLKEKYSTVPIKLLSRKMTKNKLGRVNTIKSKASIIGDTEASKDKKEKNESPLEKDSDESFRLLENIHPNVTFGAENINHNIDLTTSTVTNPSIIRKSSFYNRQKTTHNSFGVSFAKSIGDSNTKEQQKNNYSKIGESTLNNSLYKTSNNGNTLPCVSNIQTNSNNSIMYKSNLTNNSNIISQTKVYIKQYESSRLKNKYKQIKIINSHVIIQITIHLSICFIVIVYILVSQSSFFSKIDVLIECVFATSLLRDKFANLQSSIYTLVSIFSGISEKEYDIDVYHSHSVNVTVEFEEIYTSFFKYYTKYNNMANKNYEETIKLFNYTKLITSWQPINYRNDFSSEMYYLIYITNSFLDRSDSVENIQEDLNMMFKLEYLNHLNETLNSKVAPVLYYIINNGNLLFTNVIEKTSNRLRNETDDYTINFSTNNFLCEVIYILNFTFLFISLLCLVYKYNNQIFKMIISILDMDYNNINQIDGLNNITSVTSPFINGQNSQIPKSNINNYVKNNLNNFKSLLENFTKENYIVFKTKKKLNLTDTISSSSQLLHIGSFNKENLSPNINSVNSKNTSNTTSTVSKLTTSSNITNLSLLNKRYVTGINSIISNKSPHYVSKEKISQLTNISTLTNDYIKSQKNKYLPFFEIQKLQLFTMFTIAISIIYCINLCFSSLRLLLTFQYTEDVKLIQDLFLFLSGKFTLLATIFNTIRKVIYTDISYFTFIKDYKVWTTIIEEQSDYVSLNLKNFPLSKEVWSQMELKVTDPNNNIDILCISDPYCKSVLEKNNGNNYCNDGINIGIKAMIHKFEQVIQELGQFNTNITEFDEIKKYCQRVKMNGIETTIEFVISQIQINLYNKYDIDSKNLRKLRENSLAVVYSVTFIVGTGMILIVVVSYFVKIKKIVQIASFGTYKTKLLNEQWFL